jgi:hypothetical protein
VHRTAEHNLRKNNNNPPHTANISSPPTTTRPARKLGLRLLLAIGAISAAAISVYIASPTPTNTPAPINSAQPSVRALPAVSPAPTTTTQPSASPNTSDPNNPSYVGSDTCTGCHSQQHDA